MIINKAAGTAGATGAIAPAAFLAQGQAGAMPCLWNDWKKMILSIFDQSSRKKGVKILAF